MSTYEFLPHIWEIPLPALKARWHRDHKSNKTGCLGVRQRNNRFQASIRVPGRKSKVYCGTAGTAEEAARLYDAKALELFGPTAVTNFPQGKAEPA